MNKPAQSIQLVTSDPAFAKSVRRALESISGLRFSFRDEAAPQQRIGGTTTDEILLLDLSSPGTRPEVPRSFSQPVVVFISPKDEAKGIEAIGQGAQDYLVKGAWEAAELSRVLQGALKRHERELSQQRAGRHLAVQHAVASILAAARSVDEATPRLLQAICENLEWDLGALWRVQTNAEVLRCVDLWQRPDLHAPEFVSATRGFTFPPGTGLPGRVWATARPSWIADISEDAGFPRARCALKEGLHSAFGFALTFGPKVLGVMEFLSRQPQRADEHLLGLASQMGAQIGDFIERKRNEEALIEERNLLRLLVDALPDPVYAKDTESRFLIGNLAVAQLIGAGTPDYLLGKRDSDFCGPDLAQRYRADDRAVLQSGKPVLNREEQMMDAKGGEHRFLTTKVPVRDSSGEVVGLVGIARELAQAAPSQAEADRLFALCPDMLSILGSDGRFRHVNQAWEKALGFTNPELKTKPFLEFIHADDRQQTAALIGELLRGRQEATFENRCLCKSGGYKWLLWACCPLGEQQLVYVAARDITLRKHSEANLSKANAELARNEEAVRAALGEAKRAHQELKAAQLQLIQTAKLESVGTLAAGVAHEVKNPLQIILMGLDYLTKNLVQKDPNLPGVLHDMRQAISRADRIVRGLLDFSAAYRPEVKDEDLNRIIESALELVNFEIAKSRIEVKRQLGDKLPPLKLDKAKIQQVFINIFMNAVHSMPQGGTLTVRTEVRRLTDIDYDVGDRSIGRLRVGDTVCFKVGETAVVAEIEDTGTGIPEEKLANIFDPFFTTKPAGKGTGLGLTVVKKIVELHGGSIEIHNRPHGGVIVTLVFKTWRSP